MKRSLENKLQQITEHFEELSALLADPVVINDQNKFRDYSKEYAEIEPIACTYQQYKQFKQRFDDASVLFEDDDQEIQQIAEEEVRQLKPEIASLEIELQKLLLPKDPHDQSNVFLEIRAGTGGDEAAIFVGDLFRMYSKFAENQRWQVEVISANAGEHGGFKEIISRIIGNNVYEKLKFESGAHRVQRVPETESQGRIHTSACTVAVMPEATEIEAIDINKSDLRIDTYRSSGAGGQHVNKTDSAIRLTHLSTGIVVECQDERSQHKNRAKAMALLQAKLLSHEQEKQQKEQTETRRNLVGSGDRSERIRTYNYPQGRVTDHRINLTIYKLEEVMEGALEQVINPLSQEHQAEQLSEISSD